MLGGSPAASEPGVVRSEQWQDCISTDDSLSSEALSSLQILLNKKKQKSHLTRSISDSPLRQIQKDAPRKSSNTKFKLLLRSVSLECRVLTRGLWLVGGLGWICGFQYCLQHGRFQTPSRSALFGVLVRIRQKPLWENSPSSRRLFVSSQPRNCVLHSKNVARRARSVDATGLCQGK